MYCLEASRGNLDLQFEGRGWLKVQPSAAQTGELPSIHNWTSKNEFDHLSRVFLELRKILDLNLADLKDSMIGLSGMVFGENSVMLIYYAQSAHIFIYTCPHWSSGYDFRLSFV